MVERDLANSNPWKKLFSIVIILRQIIAYHDCCYGSCGWGCSWRPSTAIDLPWPITIFSCRVKLLLNFLRVVCRFRTRFWITALVILARDVFFAWTWFIWVCSFSRQFCSTWVIRTTRRKAGQGSSKEWTYEDGREDSVFSTDFPQGHVSIEEVSSPPSIAATGQWSHSKSCHCVSRLVTAWKLYRVTRWLWRSRTWFGLTLIWMFHHLAQLPSQSCKAPLCQAKMIVIQT